MNRHPAIGTLSIIASLPPLSIAAGFVLGFGVSPSSWTFLQYAIPGAIALAAGPALLIGVRWSYAVGIAGWTLLVLCAAFNLWISWRSYTAGSVFPTEILLTEILYVAVGITVITVLARRHRNGSTSRNGGKVAA